MKSKIILSLLVIIIAGCSAMNDDYISKLDSGLKTELKKANEGKETGVIGFLGKCDGEITDEIKSLVEESGVKIESTIKNIFTASGTIEQIIDLAKLDKITYLEKSEENAPLN